MIMLAPFSGHDILVRKPPSDRKAINGDFAKLRWRSMQSALYTCVYAPPKKGETAVFWWFVPEQDSKTAD